MSDPLIHIENLNYTYPDGNHALADINLTLESGNICGLVGVNGAGKSTLFKAMMGFIKPSSGSIKIQRHSVKHARKNNLIAYVPQTEDIDWDFPVRVKDLVLMGRYGHMGFMRRANARHHTIVDDALEKVGMLEYKDQQIGQLSGGQKKRIFVARALAQQGQIMFLDEPFAGVDIKTEDALIALFRSMSKNGHLILVSTHNLGSVPHFCDEVALINQTVLNYGPVETTFTQENLAKTFGGMLRHHKLSGDQLHDDTDTRGVTVLTDDERPLVLYGESGGQQITKPNDHPKKAIDD